MSAKANGAVNAPALPAQAKSPYSDVSAKAANNIGTWTLNFDAALLLLFLGINFAGHR